MCGRKRSSVLRGVGNGSSGELGICDVDNAGARNLREAGRNSGHAEREAGSCADYNACDCCKQDGYNVSFRSNARVGEPGVFSYCGEFHRQQ